MNYKNFLLIASVVLIFFLSYWFIFKNKTTSLPENISTSAAQNKSIKPTNTEPGEIITFTQEKMETTNQINISSNVFQNNQPLPSKYSYKGGNINPPLTISNIPKNTKTSALIVEDPDTSAGTLAHWLVWNIQPQTLSIEENSVPQGSVQGINAFGNNKYDGPYPPSGTHRYFFKIFALDTYLNLNTNSKKADLENAMKGHILGEASIIGLYSK